MNFLETVKFLKSKDGNFVQVGEVTISCYKGPLLKVEGKKIKTFRVFIDNKRVFNNVHDPVALSLSWALGKFHGDHFRRVRQSV